MVSSQLILNDCLVAMKDMADNSVDSIVCDPPYGLSFMNKKWDYDVPSVEIWWEALRVLKPGGHLLAFGGTRTYHRLVVNIEDAGFEVRDQIQWIFGSGFPKSMNISKAIDNAAGVEQEVVGVGRSGAPETHSVSYNMSKGGSSEMGGEYDITKPTTPEAEQWDGWGTALKPAHEPIVVARKPVEKDTIAENVLEYGTGGLNVDGSRVPLNGDYKCGANGRPSQTGLGDNYDAATANQHVDQGRFPANVILDEEAGAMLDKQAPSVGNLVSGVRKKDTRGGTGYTLKAPKEKGTTSGHFDGLGGASRFFYCAKPSRAERDGGLEGFVAQNVSDREDVSKAGANNPRNRGGIERKNSHPTVKPVDLMRYLCRLITPPQGIVLDPFMGSGTTGIAANLEEFNFIGIDMEEEYVEIARARIAHSGEYVITEDLTMKRIKQPTLFDFLGGPE